MAAKTQEPLQSSPDWLAIVARLLGLTCLHLTGTADKPVLEKAEFLMNLGMPRSEAAKVIGSSDESLRVMFGARARKAGAGNGRAASKDLGKLSDKGTPDDQID